MFCTLSRLFLFVTVSVIVIGCGEPAATIGPDINISASRGNARDIVVFIHGVVGDPAKTFTEEGKPSWLALIG